MLHFCSNQILRNPAHTCMARIRSSWSSAVKIFVFIELIGLSKSARHCDAPALQKCLCGKTRYNREVQYAVNCTDTGFKDTTMLTDLPEETQVLIFTGNDIFELPWNIFGEFNELEDLKTIDMSNNKIRVIKGKTYHHVPNVRTLILNHNNLTISNRGEEKFHHPRIFSNFINLAELHLSNAFKDYTGDELADDLHDIFVYSNLTKLNKIHLEQNEIKGFKDQNVFCDLPSLMDIYLANNDLPSLNFNITCIKKLRFLDLESNLITKFSQKELDIFDSMTFPKRNETLMIDIGRNSFRCNSEIKNLYIWMHETNVTIRNKDLVQCHQSKAGSKYIFNLKNYAVDKHARVSRAVAVLVIILSLVLITLLAAYAYLSKDKFKSKLSPLFDLVSRKVQYTTIESQDLK